MSVKAMKSAALLIIPMLSGYAAAAGGFSLEQQFSIVVFSVVIMATLLFPHLRLPIAFLGVGLLLAFRIMTLKQMMLSSELDIILFLVGMMVTVGVLKELGLFTWIIQGIINIHGMTGWIFTATVVFLSGLMACLVDEVTSIIFISALIFQVCDTLKLRPVPFMLIAVMGTNIGSAGTMLGNPVGLLIGQSAGFTFMDFIIWAFPVMLASLCITLAIMMIWFRKDIALLDEKLRERRELGLRLGPFIKVPYKRSLLILMALLVFICAHNLIEQAMGLEKNTILIVAPLLMAGMLMLWRHHRARDYIEKDVEWWTMLFFMMLFAIAGTLEHTGVTERIAAGFIDTFGDNTAVLTPVIILISASFSAIIDNVVFVSAFIPVIESLNSAPLWWALLFGACFGGNISLIGSHANIVALSLFEKRYETGVSFFEWLKIGLITGIITCIVAWGALVLLTPLMPQL